MSGSNSPSSTILCKGGLPPTRPSHHRSHQKTGFSHWEPIVMNNNIFRLSGWTKNSRSFTKSQPNFFSRYGLFQKYDVHWDDEHNVSLAYFSPIAALCLTALVHHHSPRGLHRLPCLRFSPIQVNRNFYRKQELALTITYWFIIIRIFFVSENRYFAGRTFVSHPHGWNSVFFSFCF